VPILKINGAIHPPPPPYAFIALTGMTLHLPLKMNEPVKKKKKKK
jgi:hypothetical protein